MSDALRAALDGEDEVALILDREGRIVHVNSAWSTSGKPYGAPSSEDVIGRPYVDFVGGRLKHEVARCISQALASDGVRGVMLHGECNTPEDFRRLTSQFSPLRVGGETVGVVVRHSVRAAGPLRDRYEVTDADPERFRDAHGLVLQCGCCRRVREPVTGRWRLSLSVVDTPLPDMSHGLCDACVELYYPNE